MNRAIARYGAADWPVAGLSEEPYGAIETAGRDRRILCRAERSPLYNKQHELLDILVIAICAAICGADGWEDVETFGKTREDWLEGLLGSPHGIPSDDAFRRVFAALDVEQFQTSFMKWIQDVPSIADREASHPAHLCPMEGRMRGTCS